MARKKRFGDLNRALNLLRPAAAGGNEGAAPDAPAGTRLRFYQDWRKGAREVTYTRNANSNPLKLEPKNIELFGGGITNAIARVGVSKRAFDNRATTGLDAADLGYVTTEPSYPGEVIPAKITVYTGGARTGTPERSKLTGTPYKPRASSRTFTFPFGKVGQDTYRARALTLITKAKLASGVIGASVRAEDLIIN